MKEDDKASISKKTKKVPGLPSLPRTDPCSRADKLLSVCVELMELCIEVTGTIDPAAAWLVLHAKDEVTLGAWGTRNLRPY